MKKKAYGTYEIAKICMVTPPTVSHWIKAGKLPCFTTGGGHKRVWETDLTTFLTTHNIPLPPELARAVKTTILIVDDNAAMRRALRRAMAKIDPQAQIHEAADGFEAGRQIFLLIPSLIILDLRLPGMDGHKVCRMIRQDVKLENIRILAITGYSSSQSKQEALAAGADDYLAKPFDMTELVDKINKLLGRLPSGARGAPGE